MTTKIAIVFSLTFFIMFTVLSATSIYATTLTSKINVDNEYIDDLYIGSFRIQWGLGQGIRIHNLEKSDNYPYDHPHIEDGIPCWGNMEEVETLAAKMEIEVAISMILSYLATINEDHTYEDWESWRDGWRREEGDE